MDTSYSTCTYCLSYVLFMIETQGVQQSQLLHTNGCCPHSSENHTVTNPLLSGSVATNGPDEHAYLHYGKTEDFNTAPGTSVPDTTSPPAAVNAINTEDIAGPSKRVMDSNRQRRRPYACSFSGCNASFTARHNLKSHLNAHLGLKRYKCPFCNRPFCRPYDQKRHTKEFCHLRPEQE